MEKYDHKKIESHWQKKWQETKIFEPDIRKAKRPFYNLMMFPYPSAEGLHVGNMYAFTGSDIFGRFRRMAGFNVFEPIGLDGFGIHSENYAIKAGKHPAKLAEISAKNFYRQLKATGNAYCWGKKLETYDPSYYRWTQWIFVQMYNAGLAYKAAAPVNWCGSCKTVLADEQVISGACERCGTQVIKKELEQWFFRITKYANRLLANLDKIDWSERVKIAQRNWIGRSVGATIKFSILNSQFSIEVFTTRPETLFGATYIVLSPEHQLISKIKNQISNIKEVEAYIKNPKTKTEEERIAEGSQKTGVELKEIRAVNPANKEEIPIWVADYVLMGYGTGAIMAVPAHDARDHQFAKKYNLRIVEVIKPESGAREDSAYHGPGTIINSANWNGWKVPEEIGKVIDWLEEKAIGKPEVKYHLRDWLISRQRYWGPPIPAIWCQVCGWQPVPEAELPVVLPYIENFRPTGTEKSPLATIEKFVKTRCPKCGGEAKRETDVSDTFLDSAWYFFRYPTVGERNAGKVPFDKALTKKWLPVDMYIGGAEHAVLHLLYSRFITMVFHDLGLISFEEPFAKFCAHGLLISEGAKMSKSRGNVVLPDAYIEKYGADTLRIYLMFLGPFNLGGDFRDGGIIGVRRFLERAWSLIDKAKIKNQKAKSEELQIAINRLIKKVTEDLENLRFNTAIAAMMEFVNLAQRKNDVDDDIMKQFVLLLTPFAPYMAEELWQKLGGKYSVHQQNWPKYDLRLTKSTEITIVVQVNGKLREKLTVSAELGENELRTKVLTLPKVQKYLNDKKIKNVIIVPNRLVNIVTAPN